MTSWVSTFLESEAHRERAVAKRDVVSGTVLTSAQLAEIQPALKQDFYERENRRAA